MFPENSENISPRHTFTTEEVLRNMIPKNEVGRRLLQFISSMKTQGRDDKFITFPEKIYGLDVIRKTPEYPDMDDVRLANNEIHRRKYPKIIKETEKIIKIKKKYFNEDIPDV